MRIKEDITEKHIFCQHVLTLQLSRFIARALSTVNIFPVERYEDLLSTYTLILILSRLVLSISLRQIFPIAKTHFY